MREGKGHREGKEGKEGMGEVGFDKADMDT